MSRSAQLIERQRLRPEPSLQVGAVGLAEVVESRDRIERACIDQIIEQAWRQLSNSLGRERLGPVEVVRQRHPCRVGLIWRQAGHASPKPVGGVEPVAATIAMAPTHQHLTEPSKCRPGPSVERNIQQLDSGYRYALRDNGLGSNHDRVPVRRSFQNVIKTPDAEPRPVRVTGGRQIGEMATHAIGVSDGRRVVGAPPRLLAGGQTDPIEHVGPTHRERLVGQPAHRRDAHVGPTSSRLQQYSGVP